MKKPDLYVEYKDSTYVRIMTDSSIKAELSDYFKFEVEGAKFNPKVKYGYWDGFIRLFSTKTGELPYGLCNLLHKFCSTFQYTIDIDPRINQTEKFDKGTLDSWLTKHPLKDDYGKTIEPYWYQYDSILWALQHKRGILNLPTSAGKSLIIGCLSKWFLEKSNQKVLIIVPTVALVKQMQEDLINYTLFTQKDLLGIRGGTDTDSNATVYVSTWQTACKQSTAWLQQFGMLLCDEVHLGNGKNISDINSKMRACDYKIGLTGSLKDAKSHITQLIGLYGDIYRPVNTKKLMDDGQVAELDTIQCVQFQYDEPTCKLMKKTLYQDEIKFLVQHKKRNLVISKIATANKNKNTIVLFKILTHGKLLYKLCKKLVEGTDRNVYYIAGEVKAETREKLRHIIENEKGAIIIASYGTMSTGISIKNLHRAIFAHPTKSKVINLQSIGRILRKHKSKDKAVLIDIIDDLSYKKHRNFALKHSIERIKLYIREGFEYTIKRIKI